MRHGKLFKGKMRGKKCVDYGRTTTCAQGNEDDGSLKRESRQSDVYHRAALYRFEESNLEIWRVLTARLPHLGHLHPDSGQSRTLHNHK